MSYRSGSLWRRANLASLVVLGTAMELAPHTWHVKTHVYAANLALADAVNDGKVTIPPFGDFALGPDLVEALRRHPDDYRSGVVGPDVFPDIYVGQSFAHADHWCDDNTSIADHWLRHVFDAVRRSKLGGVGLDEVRPRGGSSLGDLDLRRLAFVYGFLTHGAQDMFGHTFINHYVGAKWGSLFPLNAESLKVDAKHVALEAYVAKHMPKFDAANDSTIDVDDRFQAEHLIKPAYIKDHVDAIHYQRFLGMYGWLGTSIDEAFERMKRDTSDYNCYLVYPKDCFWLNYMIGWRLDIDRGLRHLVDANHELGESILAGHVNQGIDALMEWKSIWVPKMFGLHAVGELAAQMEALGDWWHDVNPLQPLDSIISQRIWEEVDKALARNLGPDYQYFKLITSSPAYAVDGLFPAESLARAKADMHMDVSSPDSTVRWLEFEALYNTVMASKLVLLDATGLNELARRAGMPALYPPTLNTNIMLGVMRSMDGDHQWDSVTATGVSYGLPYRRPAAPRPPKNVPGNVAAGRDVVARNPLMREPECRGTRPHPEAVDTATGFAFWQAPGAKEQIFQRIFKGWGGPGPGPAPAGMPGVPTIITVATLNRSAQLALDIDTLRRDAQLLQKRVTAATKLGAAQLSRFPQGPRKLRFNWGRVCCGPAVLQLRSALAEVESKVRGGERRARFRGLPVTPRLNAMHARLAVIDASAERVLAAPDQATARRAADDVVAGVDALARMR